MEVLRTFEKFGIRATAGTHVVENGALRHKMSIHEGLGVWHRFNADGPFHTGDDTENAIKNYFKDLLENVLIDIRYLTVCAQHLHYFCHHVNIWSTNNFL